MFDPAWLALREPVDHRSRAAALLPPLQRAWRSHAWSRIVDLGSGTGSNLRYLAPRLAGTQHWTLVDRDQGLLARVCVPPCVQTARCVVGDLGDAGLRAVAEADVVTCSALLDLVTGVWLQRLVRACASRSCGVYLALTYDGEIRWSGGGAAADDDSDDGVVRALVNAHQQRDQAEGAALGPTAGREVETLFREAGYRTWLLSSPWRLGPGDAALARALIDGWVSAAVEQRPDLERRIQAWAARRRRTVGGGLFELTVGHLDLLALPE